MTGHLVDIHLGSYDCKLNTIESSHWSTTEYKIYLKCFLFLFLFFFLFFFFVLFCFVVVFLCFFFFFFFFFLYFRFRNLQNCSKIIKSLSQFTSSGTFQNGSIDRKFTHKLPLGS